MTFSTLAVANYFITSANAEDLTDLTPMKLQKLVYFAHGWHLGLRNLPLIPDDVEAWPYGPVVSSLYHEFKHYGDSRVTVPATEMEFVRDFKIKMVTPAVEGDSSDAVFAQNLLGQVWKTHKGLTAVQLSNATHEPGTPWDQIYQQYKDQGSIPRRTVIPNDMIARYFSAKAGRSTGVK